MFEKWKFNVLLLVFISILNSNFIFCKTVQINTKLFGTHNENFQVPSKSSIKEEASKLLSSSLTEDNIQSLKSELDDVQYELSQECLLHTEMVIEGLFNGSDWALRMIDAMGKPSSALLDLHISWLGNWEECRNVEVKATTTSTGTGSEGFDGKYCSAMFPIGNASAQSLLLPGGLQLKIGMCLPDTCSNIDASILVNILVKLVLNSTSIPQGYAMCQENHLELSDKAIAVIVVLSILATIIVTATLYDIINRYMMAAEQNSTKLVNGKVYGTFKSEPSTSSDEHTPMLNGQTDHAIKQPLPSEDVKREPEVQRTGFWGQLLLSFSVYTNAEKILNTNQPSGTLTNVNGIRFISMTWVVLGHTYAFGLSSTDNVATFLPAEIKTFTFQAISNATVAVDTFFVLSGLLVAYLTLKEIEKRGGVKRVNWFMFYFHRFWRLTPPYMLVLMFYVPLIKYWGEGPLWPQQGVDIDECKDTWWRNLLYVNNMFEPEKMCMPWSWYLANDMQFFIVSPLMLIPLYYSPLLGTISCLGFVLINFISTGVISKQNELGSNMILGDNNNAAFDLTYVKPWCRIGPYAVGIYVGYLLYKTGCKVKMSKVRQLRILFPFY
ncbi:hypothetical protein ACF0H5_022200 [Mactra antiquata]